MQRYILLLYMYTVWMATALAQHADYSKMSSFIRQLEMETHQARLFKAQGQQAVSGREVCAFVQICADGESLLRESHCRILARLDDICIASIPLGCLGRLSLDDRVRRIETGRGMHALMDSMSVHVNAGPVYEAVSLPQAFTGQGVVVGIQDIGFDLTHPTFYDAAGTSYRIRAFWDQLAPSAQESDLYVGADYTTEEALLACACSRDGLKFSHGTHTAGTAAGSGAGTRYRGIAYDSDICLVSNAVSDDVEFIDSANYSKYTYATDVLGFKYIFDYAERMGQPCVISFSEGSGQDFRGDDVLYYEMLEKLTGPGRIIVSSAGNDGATKTYFCKERGVESAGTFLRKFGTVISYALKAETDFDMRVVVYGEERNDTVALSMQSIFECPDAEYVDTLQLAGGTYIFDIVAFPSCYDEHENVYEVYLKGPLHIGMEVPLSVELIGRDARVEFYAGSGELCVSGHNPSLSAGEYTHSVNSPASAPSVIAVGATAYRTQIVNSQGNTVVNDHGRGGMLADYSSIGPTFDERIKPDVVASGTNVVSSWSSYYLESSGGAAANDVELFERNGRSYGWHCSTGTSMSSPAVAGVIALWLQADPSLTPDDVLGILSRTCKHPDPSLDYPNNLYGRGEIDAYRGLLDILHITDIEGLSLHQPAAVRVALQGKELRLYFNEVPACAFSVRLYAATGSLMSSWHLASGLPVYDLDLSAFPPGVYAVQVDAFSAESTGSSLIRLP